MVKINNERHEEGGSSTKKCGKKRKTVVNEWHREGSSSIRKCGKKRKMVIPKNERHEKGSSSTIQCDKNRRLSRGEENMLWVNILSRLPLKSLMACQFVCKSWRREVSLVKKEIEFLPLDGLFIRSSSFGETTKNHFRISYISLTTKKTVEMQINSPDSLIVGSNYDTDLLGDLCSEFGGLCVENSKVGRVAEDLSDITGYQIMSTSRLSMPPCRLDVNNNLNYKMNMLDNFLFDFSGLYVQNPSQANNMFFAIHRGLVLVIHEDGAYQVHNPATRKVFVLPKSPVCMAYSDRASEGLLERAGFIIKLHSPIISVSNYMVVRLCRVSKKIEVYRSYRQLKWRVSSFNLDDELMNACWCWENYVYIVGVRTLCFLTDKNRGLAVRFKRRTDVGVYGLSLPSSVQKGSKYARLGGCGGRSLYLSSYCNNDNVGGVWIWKHVDGGLTSAQDAWVPLVEISQARMRQLSTYTPLKLVSEVLMDDDDCVIIPMGFHPVFVIVYLKIRSSVFAYDITNDTFEEVGEINDQVFGASTIALPYSPCLASLKPFIMK